LAVALQSFRRMASGGSRPTASGSFEMVDGCLAPFVRPPSNPSSGSADGGSGGRDVPTKEEERIADSPAFVSVRERLGELIDGPKTLDARFAIGSLVAHIKADPGTYGVGAVARLATSLRRDRAQLYRDAGVAECWTEAEARHLLTQPAPGGRALTWSHLVAIAALPSRKQRSRWARRASVEGLSVRELAACVTRGELGTEDEGLMRVVCAGQRFVACCEEEGLEAVEAERSWAGLDRAAAVLERVRALAGRRLEVVKTARARFGNASIRTQGVDAPPVHLAGASRNVAIGAPRKGFGSEVGHRKHQ
jgi:hypothetical protein